MSVVRTMPSYTVFLCAFGLLLFGLTACISIPDSIPADWSEKNYFRKAQDALELDYYDIANYYYDAFIVRYPENLPLIVAAQYEKAFILYKRGQYKEAKAAYEAIIEFYDTEPDSPGLMPRYRRLAEIGLETVDWKKEVDKAFLWREKWSKWASEKGENLLDPSAAPG